MLEFEIVETKLLLLMIQILVLFIEITAFESDSMERGVCVLIVFALFLAIISI